MKFRDCIQALFLDMFCLYMYIPVLCWFLTCAFYLSAYEMDRTSKYKPGNVKRQEKAERAENVKDLPKITQWLQLQHFSEYEES